MVRVCFNAGHCEQNEPGYVADPGAVGPTGLWEAHVTTQIVRGAVTKIAASGQVMAYAKRQPGARTLGRLVEMVNGSLPEIFIAVHSNAATNPHAQGAQVYYPRWPLAGSARSKSLAGILLTHLPNNATPWSRVSPATFYVLRKVRALARVLVELDFISHPQVEAVMRSAVWLDVVAARLAEGLAAFLITDWR